MVEYRYVLHREIAPMTGHANVLFCMLNPSTADVSNDDPTIRRVIGFCRAWGAKSLTVVNLYAARATDPKELWAMDDPVGPDNLRTIALEASNADVIVAAWGATPHPMGKEWRDEVIEQLAFQRRVVCLGMTKAGEPRHPLYVSKNVEPVTYAELLPPRVN